MVQGNVQKVTFICKGMEPWNKVNDQAVKIVF